MIIIIIILAIPRWESMIDSMVQWVQWGQQDLALSNSKGRLFDSRTVPAFSITTLDAWMNPFYYPVTWTSYFFIVELTIEGMSVWKFRAMRSSISSSKLWLDSDLTLTLGALNRSRIVGCWWPHNWLAPSQGLKSRPGNGSAWATRDSRLGSESRSWSRANFWLVTIEKHGVN